MENSRKKDSRRPFVPARTGAKRLARESAFEYAPVPMWEADFAALRLFVETLRAAGVNDLRAHFATHPADVQACAARVRIVAANRASLEFFGVRSERELLANLPDYFRAESWPLFAAELVALAGGAQTFNGSAPIVGPDGTPRTIELRLSVLPDAVDSWSRVLVSFADVSAGRLTEEKLKQSDEKLSDALFIARLGHWELDLASNVFTFSDEFYALLRTSAAEMGGYAVPAQRYADRFVHPLDRDLVRIETEKAIRSPSADYYRYLEHRVLFADGTEGYLSVRIKVKRDAQGRALKTYGVNQDITQQKRAELAVRESEEKFSTAFRNAPVLISITDLATAVYIDVNDEALRLSGYSREEVIGRKSYEIGWISPADRDRLVRELQVHGRIRDLEMEFRAKDGTTILGLVTGERIFLSGRECLLTVTADISERKRLEEERQYHSLQLMQADKMATLGILVAGVAHEINNPNNYIMLNSDIISRAWRDIRPILETYEREHGELHLAGLPFRELGDRFPKLVEGILDGTRRIQDIVSDLREYAVPDMGDMNRVVEINRALQSAIHLTRNMIQKNTTRFEPNLAADLPAVRGSAQKLEQVFINLIQNACYALNDPSQAIAVSSYFDATAGRVMVTVHDEGGGIAAADLAHITDPFFTTRRAHGGTGLGLSICKRIVEDHNGTMTFRSEVGRGTTVTISLPAL